MRADLRQANRIVRIGQTGSASSTGVSRFLVKIEYGEYLACKTWDGSAEGAATVLVAKPWTLRRPASRQGVNYVYGAAGMMVGERRATDATTLRWQREIIGESYAVNDEIWAIEVQQTGVQAGEPPKPVVFLDLNVDARQWLAVPIEGFVTESLAP